MKLDPFHLLLFLEQAGVSPVDDLTHEGQRLYTQAALLHAVRIMLEQQKREEAGEVVVDGFAIDPSNLPKGDLGSVVRMFGRKRN